MKLAHEPKLDAFLASPYDGSFYVGHASTLAKFGKKKYLIDCVFPHPLFMDSWHFFPALTLGSQLLEVDGVFISHCHDDHYDPKFLAALKPGTPIYITKDRTGFTKILEDKSLNVIEIPPMELFPIDAEVSVLTIPSDHNRFDSSIVLKGKNFSVYSGNDNFLSKETIQKAKEITGPLDHAYLPYAYVWWYPYCLTGVPEEYIFSEAKRLTNKNMETGLMMADVFEVSLGIPSAGNLIYYDAANSVTNLGIASPFDFVDFANARSKSYEPRIKALFSGDYALKVGTENVIITAGLTKEKFFEQMDAFIKDVHANTPPVAPRTDLTLEDFAFLKKRLDAAPAFSMEYDLYFSRRDLKGKALKVNLRNKEMKIVSEVKGEKDFVAFYVDPFGFEIWMNEKEPFESILNSQRFLVERQPAEKYDPAMWDIVRNYF